MFRIYIRTDNLETISDMEKLREAAADLKPFWRGACREFIIRRFRRVFLTNGYGRWAETKRPNLILRDTRRMYRSFTRPDYTDNINKVSDKSFEWGTETPYAQYHETGTSRMVARPVAGFVVARRGFERALAREFEKYFRGVIDES